MKKVIKRFVLLAMLVLMLGLFGCGSTLTTNLTVSDNFAGTRTMDVSISQADFDEYVTEGDFETIAAETKEITPECLQFSYEETADGKYVFHFVMAFTSQEDYETQITSILGVDHTLEFTVSKSPFAQGVSLKEDYSSADLLQWFKDYLIEREYVSSDYSAYIFEYTDNFVSISGKEYESYKDDLDVAEKVYVQIEALNIFTDIDAGNGKIARKIELVFDDYVIENNREVVETYLASVTPEGCQGEWAVTEDGFEKYILVIPACSPDEMTLVMQTFCASEENSVNLIVAGENVSMTVKEDEEAIEETDEASVSYSDVWDKEILGDYSTANQVDSKIYVQPFGFESTIEETLDLNSFVCDSWGEIESSYYISVKNGKPESMIYYPNGDEAYGWDYIEETQPDYYYVESQWQPDYQVISTVNKYYVPTSTEINTVVKSEDKITREFVFKFNEPFEKAVIEKIEAKLDSLFEKHKDILSVKIKNKKKETSITWKFEGSVAEVDSLCDEIFGMGYSSVSYYGQDKFALRQQYDYTESIDLGSIFDWEYSGNIDYTLKVPGKISKENTSVTGGVSSDVNIRGKKIDYLATESGYLNARVSGAKTNTVFVVMIIAILLFVLAICGGVVFFILKMSKQSETPQSVPQPDMVAQSQPGACSNCGTAIPEGGVFCPNCGTSVTKL